MARPLNLPWQSHLDALGAIAAGAKLYTYAAGTSTPLATYTDAALTIPHANPVVADAAGRFAAIYLQDASYKLVLKDTTGATTFGQVDHFTGLDASSLSGNADDLLEFAAKLNVEPTLASASALRALTALDDVPERASLLSWTAGAWRGGGEVQYVSTDSTTADDGFQTFVDAASRRWHRPKQTVRDVVEAGADPTGTNDSKAAIQAAIDAVSTAGGGIVTMYPGTYNVSGNVNLKSNVVLWAPYGGVTIRPHAGASFGATGIIQPRSNSMLIGITVTGQRADATYANAFCLYMRATVAAVENFVAMDCTFRDTNPATATYDPIYLDDFTNIALIRCKSINAGRNFLSVISGSKLLIDRFDASGTFGTYAVDFEPNVGDSGINDVIVRDSIVDCSGGTDKRFILQSAHAPHRRIKIRNLRLISGDFNVLNADVKESRFEDINCARMSSVTLYDSILRDCVVSGSTVNSANIALYGVSHLLNNRVGCVTDAAETYSAQLNFQNATEGTTCINNRFWNNGGTSKPVRIRFVAATVQLAGNTTDMSWAYTDTVNNYFRVAPGIYRSVTSTSAAPASGTFNRSDIAIPDDNAGDVVAYVCTVAGTPGTWTTLYTRPQFIKKQEKAGAIATSDVPDGYAAVFEDTSGGTRKLYLNDGGVLYSVALA